MAKNKSENNVEETVATPATTTTNFVLAYRTRHPKDRISYGVEGNAGIVVIDLNLFPGGKEPGFVPPTTITLDTPLVSPKAKVSVDKAAAQAAKLAERAAKAQAKVEATQAKVAERAAKAEAALAAARAKVEALVSK